MKIPYKIIMNLLQRRKQKIKRENDLLVTPPSSMKVSDLCLIPDQFKFLWSLPRFFQTFSVSARHHLVLLMTTTYLDFVVVQSLSRVQLFVNWWTAAHQASLTLTMSWSLPKFMSTESLILSKHLILCHPLLLLPSTFAGIRVFFNESVLRIRWPKYWSFGFSINPSNEYSGLISFRISGLISLLSKGLSESSPAPQFESTNSSVVSLL